MKKRSIFAIILVFCVILCCMLVINQFSKNSTQKQINKIYQDEQMKIINSEMVDLYLIASALYFDFDSDYFISGANELEKDTISYFLPYKDHPFIRNMGAYVDDFNKCYDFNTLVPLVTYCTWTGSEPPEEVLLSNVFKTKTDFDSFLKGLTQFYKDVNGTKYFAEQKKYIDKFRSEVHTFDSTYEIQSYIKEMEQYILNKEMSAQVKNIEYVVVASFFKIDGASYFANNHQQAEMYFCVTGILQEHKDIQSINMDRIMENIVHEYLHCYINAYVEYKMEIIDNLYLNEKKSDYVSGGYLYMPWNRIIDENIVRAISTRIIGRVIGDEKKAFEQIMRREIEFGGFSKVKKIYDILPVYEEHRNEYTGISEYIQPMIEILLNE